MTSETTIEDRIAARIARIDAAKDQVVKTLIADLKASIRGAEAGGQVANPLERRAVEVLERLIGVAPASVEAANPFNRTCVVVEDDPSGDLRAEIEGQLSIAADMGLTPAEARLLIGDPSVDEGPVTLDDPRFAAHPVAQANAASWPRPKRTRRPTRAEKIAASKAGA